MTRALVAAVAMLAALPAAAHASLPGADGVLLYYQGETGGGSSDVEGFTTTASGFSFIGPTCGEDSQRPCPGEPSWAPDGRRLAFGIGGTIASMRADGSDVRKLSLPAGITAARSPSWSPNGASIVFSARSGGHRGLYVTGADLASPVTRLGAAGDDPSWSARNRIAFTLRHRLFTMPAAGGPARRLPGSGAQEPDWSPTGGRIAFVRHLYTGNRRRHHVDRLYLIGAGGRGLRKLSRRDAGEPSWRPSGTVILFTSYDGFNIEILGIRARGGRARFVEGGSEGRRLNVHEPAQQPIP